MWNQNVKFKRAKATLRQNLFVNRIPAFRSQTLNGPLSAISTPIFAIYVGKLLMSGQQIPQVFFFARTRLRGTSRKDLLFAVCWWFSHPTQRLPIGAIIRHIRIRPFFSQNHIRRESKRAQVTPTFAGSRAARARSKVVFVLPLMSCSISFSTEIVCTVAICEAYLAINFERTG